MLADDSVQDPSHHVIAAAPSCREGIGYGVQFGVSVTDVGQDAYALSAGMGTIDEMLVEATSKPALPTLEEPPGGTQRRVARLLLTALQ